MENVDRVSTPSTLSPFYPPYPHFNKGEGGAYSIHASQPKNLKNATFEFFFWNVAKILKHFLKLPNFSKKNGVLKFSFWKFLELQLLLGQNNFKEKLKNPKQIGKV